MEINKEAKMLVNQPVAHPGTDAEKLQNYFTHFFYDGRCMDCDCNSWGTTKDYPCGTEPPRETVEV